MTNMTDLRFIHNRKFEILEVELGIQANSISSMRILNLIKHSFVTTTGPLQ